MNASERGKGNCVRKKKQKNKNKNKNKIKAENLVASHTPA